MVELFQHYQEDGHTEKHKHGFFLSPIWQRKTKDHKSGDVLAIVKVIDTILTWDLVETSVLNLMFHKFCVKIKLDLLFNPI